MSTTLQNLAGIGPKTLQKLNRLKIVTDQDLLYHFPNRYLDFRHHQKIAEIEADKNITIRGQITFFQNIYTKSHKNLQIATVKDSSGQITLIWFNQPYLQNTIKKGQIHSFAGVPSFYQNRLTIISPISGQHNTGKIIAVYPQTEGLTSNWFRKTIDQHLDSLTRTVIDPLPLTLRHQFKLIDLKTALTQIHQPQNPAKLIQAQTRLKLAEILSLQIKSLLQKQRWQQLSPNFSLKLSPSSQKKIRSLINSLPFTLTPDQQTVWRQIKKDITSKNQPANRLLQGDVGSGKTIVALLACYLTHLNSHLSILLAPTEILAKQHYRTFRQILKKYKVPIKLLTAKNKIKTLQKNAIIISTHAAIYQKKSLSGKIALLIVDEQHKFGVIQRDFLKNPLKSPHCLTMTATPIPRSISLTLMGNLDLSLIKHKPKNRLPVKTFLVPSAKTGDCYQWVKKHIKKTAEQAFIVCPFIEASETLSSVKSAKDEFDHLAKNIFPNLKLSLIHGKIKPNARQKIISDFQKNLINILITTPIIEVGIDIKNATIIIIQSADRFGLAQLHQLRGRVGRGEEQSYCYFFTQSQNQNAIDRLKFLQTHHDGLAIAKYDLSTRGPGEAFSTLQHGFPSLKLANLEDSDIIKTGHSILKILTAKRSSPKLDKFIIKN